MSKLSKSIKLLPSFSNPKNMTNLNRYLRLLRDFTSGVCLSVCLLEGHMCGINQSYRYEGHKCPWTKQSPPGQDYRDWKGQLLLLYIFYHSSPKTGGFSDLCIQTHYQTFLCGRMNLWCYSLCHKACLDLSPRESCMGS